jgi:hypothetical protein
MSLLVGGLAVALVTTIGGVVTTYLMRRPNPVENQVANDGAWEKQMTGFSKINDGWERRVVYLEGIVEPMQNRVVDLSNRVEAAERLTDSVIAWARQLLSWGHDAGATSPPDPPPGLVIPGEPDQEGTSA